MIQEQNKIQVLVVDDSAFMRSALKSMINADPGLNVIGTCRDGLEAIERIQELNPDIVTLDLEMPRMDGLSALRIIMEKMPVPVIVVSSLSEEGAQITFQALDLGAVDFVCKDLQSRSMNILNIENSLVTKLKEFGTARTRPRFHGPDRPQGILQQGGTSKPSRIVHNVALVAIGVSTGGPRALQQVIPQLPKDFLVPVMIVQHMPEMFTKQFAERLNDMSELTVKEAEHGELIEAGKVLIGRGGINLLARRIKPLEVRIELNKFPEMLYHPSADVMMHSAVEAFQGRVLGVVMTGMGNDGTDGMKAIKRAGGKTLVQDEQSCVVYGMPRAVVEAGVADKVAPLGSLASEIVNMV